jgi:TM2 domain-containing membrane protein YozV/ribosomal protein L40E
MVKYCRHCGKEVPDQAVVCAHCGSPPMSGARYCDNCGAETDAAAEFCVKCGWKLTPAVAANAPPAYGTVPPSPGTMPPPPGPTASTGTYRPAFAPAEIPEAKSKLAAGLFGIFLGWLGVHRFYLGYNMIAIIQLLLGLCGFITCGITTIAASIWGIVEGIMILTGSINADAQGRPLKE